MMNRKSVEVIKQIYKPYKYTIQGRAHILESTSGNVVIKEKGEDIRTLYEYLQSRNFTHFPALLDDSRDGINVFEYVPDTKMPKEQKAMDFIKVVALLHQKTTYYKDVSEDEFKKIYDKVHDNIEYLKYFYDNLYEEYYKEIYPSPSQYFLLNNFSKVYSSLLFSERELEIWYSKVRELKKYRVCQIHNHLSLDHFCKSKEECLLSWEKSTKDTPVLDLIGFYKNCYFDMNFETLFHEYLKYCPWSDEERLLFFIVISIPPKFELKGTEFELVKNIREVLDYVYKTESLVRPYYTVEEKQQ